MMTRSSWSKRVGVSDSGIRMRVRGDDGEPESRPLRRHLCVAEERTGYMADEAEGREVVGRGKRAGQGHTDHSVSPVASQEARGGAVSFIPDASRLNIQGCSLLEAPMQADDTTELEWVAKSRLRASYLR